ncbi:MAG: Calx-beta domain-containing protein [Acidobacteriota bacterium]|nr:Calx-beta domain-containing protein [Acidobacteriota bacterium]
MPFTLPLAGRLLVFLPLIAFLQDLPQVTVVGPVYKLAESTEDIDRFTLTRTGGELEEELTVMINLSGDALVGVDYLTDQEGFITFMPDQTTAELVIQVLVDEESEGDEQVELQIVPIDDLYIIGEPGFATATITDLPYLQFFRAEPKWVRLGEQILISWWLSNYDEATLEPGLNGEDISVIPLRGMTTATPEITTTYKLHAKRAGFSSMVVLRTVHVLQQAELLTNGDFEQPNAGWSFDSSRFDTPICDESCGIVEGWGPHGGSFWCWFGGTNLFPETAFIEQEFQALTGEEADLSFFLAIDPGGGDGSLTLFLNDETVEVFTGQDAGSYRQIVQPVGDLFVDGTNRIRFEAQTQPGGAATDLAFNIMLDDISLRAWREPVAGRRGEVRHRQARRPHTLRGGGRP